VTDASFDTLTLAGRRVPDYSWETDASGVKFQEELPGTYEVGFLHEGVFRPIVSFPAAGFLADVERAKQAAKDAPPEPDTSTSTE
jgi:hypothetical protein